MKTNFSSSCISNTAVVHLVFYSYIRKQLISVYLDDHNAHVKQRGRSARNPLWSRASFSADIEGTTTDSQNWFTQWKMSVISVFVMKCTRTRKVFLYESWRTSDTDRDKWQATCRNCRLLGERPDDDFRAQQSECCWARQFRWKTDSPVHQRFVLSFRVPVRAGHLLCTAVWCAGRSHTGRHAHWSPGWYSRTYPL